MSILANSFSIKNNEAQKKEHIFLLEYTHIEEIEYFWSGRRYLAQPNNSCRSQPVRRRNPYGLPSGLPSWLPYPLTQTQPLRVAFQITHKDCPEGTVFVYPPPHAGVTLRVVFPS